MKLMNTSKAGLHRRLGNYVTLAVTAGAGAGVANADVIYTAVNLEISGNKQIRLNIVNGSFNIGSFNENVNVAFSSVLLGHNCNENSWVTGVFTSDIWTARVGGGMSLTTMNALLPAALDEGEEIGVEPFITFDSGDLRTQYNYSNFASSGEDVNHSTGDWSIGQENYLGFYFWDIQNKSGPYYAWIAFTLTDTGFLINSYAFEDSGETIFAGEGRPVPAGAGLAVLALGAAGLRRRRQA